jgi:hypothetical protein
MFTEVDYTTAGWNSLSTAAPDEFHYISDINANDKTEGISHYCTKNWKVSALFTEQEGFILKKFSLYGHTYVLHRTGLYRSVTVFTSTVGF